MPVETSPFPWDQSTTVSEAMYPAYECNECGHRWTPRKDEPSSCPNCRRQIAWSDDDGVRRLSNRLPSDDSSERGGESEEEHSLDEEILSKPDDDESKYPLDKEILASEGG